MKRTPAWTALLGIALVVAVADARPGEPDAPPAVQHVESDDGNVAIDVPAAWTIEREIVEQSPVSLRIAIAGVPDIVYLTVYHLHGIRGERGQAYRERRAQPDAKEAKGGAVVSLDPVPNVTMDFPEGGRTIRRVLIFRVIDRDGFSISITCSPGAWPAIKDACFSAAASLTSKLGEWPARPAGYKAVVRDGYEYLVHPKVKDKDVDVLHEVVLDQEKRYAKLHGPVLKPASNQIVIVVTPDNATAATLFADAKSESNYAADFLGARIFAVPMKKDDFRARTSFVDRIAAILNVQGLGDSSAEPIWLNDGERIVAAAEAWSGKPLPAMSLDFSDRLARSLVPFEELTRAPPKDVEAQSLSYVAFFRAGPQTYRDAFAAFLKDVAATGDWEAAQKKNLLSLDQDQMRIAAQSFVAKDLKFLKAQR